MKGLIQKRLNSLEQRFCETNLFSYDPYDGLNTPLSGIFFRNKFLERIWQQSIRLAPVNIRPVIGVKRKIHTKEVSDLLTASSILYRKFNEEKHYANAGKYFLLLKELAIKKNKGVAWGLRFKFTTRFIQADEVTPNLFNTVNALNSLLDFYLLSKEKSSDEVCGQVEFLIQQGLNYIFYDLGFSENDNEVTWNYWENLEAKIFNVNALMVGLLSRCQNIFNSNGYDVLINKTINFLKNNQNENGSWYYSNDGKGNFIDGFHSGYILEALSVASLNGFVFEKEFFEKGAMFFLKNFFTEDYLPKYFHDKLYPLDGQNFAQAVQTLFYLNKLNYVEKDFLHKVFENADKMLWNNKGYYNYMKSKYFFYKMPMDRWVNAPMYLALSYIA